jgi:arylsulfatase A-like enzyme
MARFQAETGEAEFRNSPGLVKKYTDATFVTDEAVRWMGELPADQPFMLWVHYMEPHGPYVPPAKYATYFAGQHASKRLTVREIPHYQLQYDTASAQLITDHGYYVAQYDREIRYLDDELGRLFHGLEQNGRREHTLVVFTADHGESLGEHDYYFEHGRVPYQTTGQVPWIMSLPGRLPAGKVLPMPVGLIDLVPTVLETLGIDRAATVEGVSLYPAMRGESSEAPPFVHMVRWGPWKLVHFRHPRDRDELKRGEFALFNLHEDPGEVHDVGAAHPDVVAKLRRAFDGHGRGDGAVADATEESETLDGLDPETVRLLKSLGYLD